MKKNHIQKIKPLKISGSAVVKTKATGIACIPSGEPPVSVL